MPKVQALVRYNVGSPTETGVYACRVPNQLAYANKVPILGIRPTDVEDKFLMWHEGKWWYLGSDQRYRGPVLGWVGPLERKVR